ncbi:rRNA methyltransferase 3, mitochondrial isoform X1 [Oryzias latipes]|uniref:Mitochondrial rRNA methyltransferase 3a n=2 Tax=Oryzias latipes TaxID=8090 RepID=A0A3B3I5A0_ORYLA|nr:rRNA methyltransferase 3, mitochondrial isoform X1 [Oryzias latipes]
MAAVMRSMVCLFPKQLLSKSCGLIVEPRRFVRGLRRKPAKVLFPEQQTGKVVKPAPESDQTAVNPQRKKTNVTSATAQTDKKNPVRIRDDADSTVQHPRAAGTKDQVDGLRFERASQGDKRLAKLVSVARSRTFREHQGKILLEGRRLICDALHAGAMPQTVFFSTVDRLRELPLDKLKRAALVKVKFEEIKLWSDVVAPQGVIAIFSRSDPSRLNYANKGQSVGLSLICDNIRDPGNLGTMLRCAAAAGCSSILLTKGCVDAWEPKVLRAAMGAHFKLPIYPNLEWGDIENHLPASVTVHVADHNCGSETELDLLQKPTKAGDFGWVSSKPNPKNVCHEEYNSDSDSDDDGLSVPRVDAKVYYENWAQTPTALVIGGETHGLSLEAVQLAEKTDGLRLFIPIVPGVDSLNSAMAASILLFEGRRQLLKVQQASGEKRKTKAQR